MANEPTLADILAGAANIGDRPSQPPGSGGLSLADISRAAGRVTGLGVFPILSRRAQEITQAMGVTQAPPKPDPSTIDLAVDLSRFAPEFADKQQRLAAAGAPDWLLQALRQLYLFRQQRSRELSGVGPTRGMAATPLDALLTGAHDAPLLPYAAPATPTDILSNAAGLGRNGGR